MISTNSPTSSSVKPLDSESIGTRWRTLANLSDGFDGLLLVVHASRTPKSLARETIDDLLEAGTNLLGVVLNGC